MKHALNLFSAPDKNLQSRRSYIVTLYASCCREFDRAGKKSRSVSLPVFLVFCSLFFSLSLSLVFLSTRTRTPVVVRRGECPANRAIIRETHLGARQTRLNLFAVDPMPTRQPLLVLVSLRC